MLNGGSLRLQGRIRGIAVAMVRHAGAKDDVACDTLLSPLDVQLLLEQRQYIALVRKLLSGGIASGTMLADEMRSEISLILSPLQIECSAAQYATLFQGKQASALFFRMLLTSLLQPICPCWNVSQRFAPSHAPVAAKAKSFWRASTRFYTRCRRFSFRCTCASRARKRSCGSSARQMCRLALSNCGRRRWRA